MDVDHGGRRLAGLVLDAAGRGDHDQVTDLIAPLDADQLRFLVTVLAVQVDQHAPARGFRSRGAREQQRAVPVAGERPQLRGAR